MSAKSSNFALVNAENMEFTQYTKTCRRCRLSWWEDGAKGVKLACPYSPKCEKACKRFAEHDITHEYFFGHLKPDLKAVLTGIYLGRMKRGEF